MTDLSRVKAATVQPQTPLRQAEQAMIYLGELVATLQRLGRNHLLVVEPGDADTQRVRGVISRARIERHTGVTIAITPIATTFAEIERALA